jgi:uncharacterized membrane protein
MLAAVLVGIPVQVLPSGLEVPPVPYLLALLVGGTAVAGGLYTRRPPVTQSVVIALAPWMTAGAAAHALFQLRAAPEVAGPLLAAPAVYLTTFVLAGAIWLALLEASPGDVPRLLGATGAIVTGIGAALVLGVGLERGTLAPVLPTLAVVISVALTAALLAGLRRFRPETANRAGRVGALVVFAHTLDGISTAIGVDFLGAGERSPIPRAIMEFAGTLPTAELLGQGWLFVVVKLAIAVVVVDLFTDFLEEEPLQGNLALALVAAVGLGPGTQNVLLFAAGAG